MTQENTNSIQEAEASLDEAIATIKGSEESNNINVFDDAISDDKPEETPKQREILTLPKKDDSIEESNELESVEETEPNNDNQGQDFVQTDSPDVQKRIDHLYKESKTKDEQNMLLRDELRKLTKAMEAKDANEKYLAQELSQIKSRITQNDDDKVLSELRNEYKEAIEDGEYDKALQINEKIVDFKAEQKLNSFIEQSQKQTAPEQQQKKPTFEFDAQDVSDIEKLSSEKSEDGQVLRPWLNQQHPDFEEVVDLSMAIANKHIRKGLRPSIDVIMQEIDAIKGIKKNQIKQPSIPPVLSGQGSVGLSKENPIKLNSLEKSFAAKLGVKESEYAKMRKLSNSQPISVEAF